MRSNKIAYILLATIVCIFTFSVMMINNSANQTSITTSTSSLSNKKIGWGIKRNDNHEQPDLGSKNKELLEKYDGIAMGNKEKKLVYLTFDEDKCTGCGICVDACHEGAIGLVNGKAKLMRDDYCDGLGDCLPTCPTGAISFIEKDTLAYDEEAVKKNMEKRMQESGTMHSGCPGSMMHTLNRIFKTTTTWYFHTNNGYTFNRIHTNNITKLF